MGMVTAVVMFRRMFLVLCVILDALIRWSVCVATHARQRLNATQRGHVNTCQVSVERVHQTVNMYKHSSKSERE